VPKLKILEQNKLCNPTSIRFKAKTLEKLNELGKPAEVARIMIETAFEHWSEFEKLGVEKVD